MPIYEYVCQDCQARFEVLRTIKDADAMIRCDHCNSEHTSRCLSIFFAHGNGNSSVSNGGGCAGCAGGSCANCH